MGNEAVHLLFSMNRWEMKQQLTDLLASGTNVVCDRYAYSGVAYSVAKVSQEVVFANLSYIFRDSTSNGVLGQIGVLYNPT